MLDRLLVKTFTFADGDEASANSYSGDVSDERSRP